MLPILNVVKLRGKIYCYYLFIPIIAHFIENLFFLEYLNWIFLIKILIYGNWNFNHHESKDKEFVLCTNIPRIIIKYYTKNFIKSAGPTSIIVFLIVARRKCIFIMWQTTKLRISHCNIIICIQIIFIRVGKKNFSRL